MPQGVYVFDVMRELRIPRAWLCEVLNISTQRYGRLKRGEVLFDAEERDKVIAAFRATYHVPKTRLFDRNPEILDYGRRRRAKGTVTRPPEGSAA